MSTETVGASDGGTPMTLTPGVVVANRYEIRACIGSGGYSVVYAADDRLVRRPVALKLLRGDRVSPTAMARFRREVDVARKIGNPHVVRVYDLGESEQGVFITMELVETGSLRRQIEKAPLSVDETIRIGSEILTALMELHRLGIIHRDVKPSNVLIDRSGRAMLADLGLARHLDSDESRLTRSDAVVGTMEYLAPEQALGLTVDQRSDLYSFGVLLYECLTAELPFDGRSTVGTLLAHLRQKAPEVRKRRPDVPVWLDRVIRKLLEKEPARRFPDASAVLRSIERRRAPRQWRSAAVLTFGVALAATSIPILLSSRPEPAISLVADGGGTEAHDTDGRTFWHRDDVQPDYARVLRRKGKEALVAAIVGKGALRAPDRRRELTLLNARTGRVERRIRLPEVAALFPGYTPDFSVMLSVVDTNHDGHDELLLNHIHDYWPNYLLHFDVATLRTTVVFIGAGHHFPFGSADLDGDGADEVLMYGINNRLGWYADAVAVRIRIDTGKDGLRSQPACAPGLGISYCADSPLLWYALLPRGWGESGQVDRDRRTVTVVLTNGRKARLDAAGFATPPPSPMTAIAREELRRTAFRTLDHCLRLRATASDRALEEARSAAGIAKRIGEPFLEEAARRFELQSLVRLGRAAEGDALASTLMSGSDGAADIAFDAATAFHLAGDLDRAVRYYRRGLFDEREASGGRIKYEFIEGAVLALIEQKKFGEAINLADHAAESYPEFKPMVALVRSVASWRAGETVAPVAAYDTAFLTHRYWLLEVELAANGDSPSLRQRLSAELSRQTGVTPLLESLQAELLARDGKIAEAVQMGRRSLAWSEQNRAKEVVARAHHSLIAARLSALERHAGGR
jgi:hypothetical protein